MSSQFLDVVLICKGRKWWTLREIESECVKRFGKHHTQPAISARLREVTKLQKLGLVKDRKDPESRKSKIFKYRLIKTEK